MTEEFKNEDFTLKTNQMFSVHTMTEEFENEDFTLKTHQMFSVHTMTEEFENEDFTLKTNQMFSVHTTLEEFENGDFTLKTNQMFSVPTTLEEFENGDFTLKTNQMFSVRTTLEEFKSAIITGHSGQGNHKTIVTSSFSKSSVFTMLCVHTYNAYNEKPAFSNSSSLKSVFFEKLRFRDGLVWTVGLTAEIKLRFQTPPTKCGRDLSFVG